MSEESYSWTLEEAQDRLEAYKLQTQQDLTQQRIKLKKTLNCARTYPVDPDDGFIDHYHNITVRDRTPRNLPEVCSFNNKPVLDLLVYGLPKNTNKKIFTSVLQLQPEEFTKLNIFPKRKDQALGRLKFESLAK